jgi:hypothetical protein
MGRMRKAVAGSNIAQILGISLAMWLGVQPAQATPVIEFAEDGGAFTQQTTTTTTGCGAGCQTFIGAFGHFAINVTTALNSGTSGSPNLDLSSLNVSSISTGVQHTLHIRMSDVGFTLTPFHGVMTVGGVVSPGGPVSFRAYADQTNTPFGAVTLLGAPLIFTGAPFSGLTTFNVSLGTPYSLTLAADLTTDTTGRMQVSFNQQLQTAPESGTLLLLGMGLAGIGFWRYRTNTSLWISGPEQDRVV